MINFSSTFLIGLTFLYLDSFAFRGYPSIKLILDYFCSFAYAYFILYLSPKIQYELTQWQRVERKSKMEELFLSKLNFMFVFNTLICPLINGLFLEYVTGHAQRACQRLEVEDETQQELTFAFLCLCTIKDIQQFYTRLTI